MKKMTFALACASTFALFAEIEAPKADFEGYEAGAKVSDAVDPNSQSAYWFYDSTSGSEDGSTVKAYGSENLAAPTTGDAAGDKYLELSTEGGTLWRSLAAGNTSGTDIAGKLGGAQAVPADGLYIDTMVQFTPTEDGGDPTLDPTTDKLAIWLNVKDNVTNLCARTKAIARPGYVPSSSGAYADGAWSQTEKTIVLSGEYSASTWYRLTVQAVKSVTSHADAEVISGFIISIDGNPVTASEQLVGDDAINYLNDDAEGGFTAGWVSEDNIDLIRSKKFIPSLAGVQDSGSATVLQAVGFKGSGALDNLSISKTAPSPAPEKPTPVTPEITLSATEATFSALLVLPTVTVAGNYVLDTDYTVSWSGALPTENPSEDVVLTVTVKMCGKYSGSNTATFTVKPASTPPVVTDWPSDPTTVKDKTANEAYGITGDLAGVPADKLAIWAKGNGKVAFSDAGDIKVEAFLLNVANTTEAIDEGKKNFKIPSITIDANGTVTVTSPDPDGSKYNGVITIKGSVTVNGTYNLDKADATARFFKAFLSVK